MKLLSNRVVLTGMTVIIVLSLSFLGAWTEPQLGHQPLPTKDRGLEAANPDATFILGRTTTRTGATYTRVKWNPTGERTIAFTIPDNMWLVAFRDPPEIKSLWLTRREPIAVYAVGQTCYSIVFDHIGTTIESYLDRWAGLGWTWEPGEVADNQIFIVRSPKRGGNGGGISHMIVRDQSNDEYYYFQATPPGNKGAVYECEFLDGQYIEDSLEAIIASIEFL